MDRKAIIPAFGFATVSGLLAWRAVFVVEGLVTALRSNGLVEWSPPDAIVFPLCLVFLALAAMTLLPLQKSIGVTRNREARKPTSVRGSTTLFSVVAIGMVLTFAAAPIGKIIVGRAVEKRDFAACTAKPGERHARMRWAPRAVRAQLCPVPA